MSSASKCKNCGSSDIEVDPARGDAVCTNCGSVLEDNINVSGVQFEEGAQGTSHVVGEFVSANAKGPCMSLGTSFYMNPSVESREITLKKARNCISLIGSKLRMNQHCIDTACNFFGMALSRQLTKGRRSTHVYAACIYLACRTEGTSTLLIDISDVMQICCYELGKTYLKLSKALHINVPTMDPCLYTMRFAAELQFGPKTQQVANTALRVLQRMKRDSIHYGRRPSGLCGAALLMAARLHEFNRTTQDIVKIVKVHESTIRKRLIEFGDTPSSGLTLEEFLTVDLDEEQDPPSFKAARRKDKDRVQKILEDEADDFSRLQKEIEEVLEKRRRTNGRWREIEDEDKFIEESTKETVSQLLKEQSTGLEEEEEEEDNPHSPIKGLGPDSLVASMGLAQSLHDTSNSVAQPNSLPEAEEVTLDDLDEEEIDTYIFTEQEYKKNYKRWHEKNAKYLEDQRIKEEKEQKEREEGKPEKKKRKASRKKSLGPASSAGEAIERVLREKKISNKINYEVLKSLSSLPTSQPSETSTEEDTTSTTSESIKRRRLSSVSSLSSLGEVSKIAAKAVPNVGKSHKKSQKQETGLPVVEDKPSEPAAVEAASGNKDEAVPMSEEEDYYEDEDNQPAQGDDVVGSILRQQRDDDFEDYGCDDMDDW